jgi:hypothetical protein
VKKSALKQKATSQVAFLFLWPARQRGPIISLAVHSYIQIGYV